MAITSASPCRRSAALGHPRWHAPAPNAPLRAQITEVARTPIADAAQVTFGYVCDDRFMIRNDGTKPIDLEYGLEKGTEHTRITLNAREAVELAMRAAAVVVRKVGVATATGAAASGESLLQLADRAMYWVKGRGKNGIHVAAGPARQAALAGSFRR